MRVLEQQEASMQEVELITAREIDGYYEELLASVPQTTNTQPQQPQAPPSQAARPAPPQVPTPQTQPAAVAADSTPGTQQPLS
eukprot:2788423-Amphidinium_carterae.3